MNALPGRIARLSVSRGGVPKHEIEEAEVTRKGLTLDRQANLVYHGGPDRAVSLFSLEVIERLRLEGHPIEPGSTGENVTLSGIDWPSVRPGSRIAFAGGVVLEVLSYCSPCKKISGSFLAGDFTRIAQTRNPGESRVYSRVLVEGRLRAEEGATLLPG